jgi:NAD(P)-dependent dehydrogenase (short-subunit alcohol dehydrogenase family)
VNILITGANKGLGFEAARQLLAAGHQVWIGARDPARGRSAADALKARFVQLDVTDEASVAAAAETVGELDALVNNAGVSGGRIGPSEATADQMRAVFETDDAFGVTFADSLRETWGRDRLDFLINNAGMQVTASFADATEDGFDRLVNVHFKGVFFLTQKLLPLVADGGAIVNISSGTTRVHTPERIRYRGRASVRFGVGGRGLLRDGLRSHDEYARRNRRASRKQRRGCPHGPM